MTTARDYATRLYLQGIRDGQPREAVETCTGARYTQHSTGVKDGREGFIEFFDDFLSRNPKRDIRVVRALQNGRHVFLHVHQTLNGGESAWVTTDFFDSDETGKIIEHWDVIAPYHATNPSGRSTIDGPTEIVDRHLTEANKVLVAGFIETCLINREIGRIGDYIDATTYHQHNAELGDGLDAFLAHFGPVTSPLSYQQCVLMVGEGNFVATLNRAHHASTGDLCQADLYRIDRGRIVEHWDCCEPVPPRDQWVNSGKF